MSELSLEDLFDLIHKKQAKAMLDILKKGTPSAQELNAINKFLSDNNVTGIKAENTAVKKLTDGLKAYEDGDTNIAVFPNT